MLRHTRLEDLIEDMCSSPNSRVGLCLHSTKDQSNKVIRATSIAGDIDGSGFVRILHPDAESGVHIHEHCDIIVRVRGSRQVKLSSAGMFSQSATALKR